MIPMPNISTVRETQIKLETINDVTSFVESAAHHKCITTLISNRYIVDAKSLMGVLSLDLSKPIKLVLETNDSSIDDRDDFMNDIAKFECALSCAS